MPTLLLPLKMGKPGRVSHKDNYISSSAGFSTKILCDLREALNCKREGVCFPPDRGHWSWEAKDQPRRRGKGLSTGTCRRPQAISCVQVRRPGERGSDTPRKDWSRKRPWWNTCCLSVSWVKTQTVKSVTKYLENSEMENYNLQEQQEIGQQRKSTHRPLRGSSWTVFMIS